MRMLAAQIIGMQLHEMGIVREAGMERLRHMADDW